MKPKQTSLTDSKTYPGDAEALTLEARGACHNPAGLLQQLFHLISATSVRALQPGLNAAACFVMKKRKYDRITATLRNDLHWPPIRQRVSYKQCTMVYTSACMAAPVYLTEMCVPVVLSTGRQ